MGAYKNALSWKKIAYGVVSAEKRSLAVAGGAMELRFGKFRTRMEFLKFRQNSLKG
jgi:hypothetical protein